MKSGEHVACRCTHAAADHQMEHDRSSCLLCNCPEFRAPRFAPATEAK